MKDGAAIVKKHYAITVEVTILPKFWIQNNGTKNSKSKDKNDNSNNNINSNNSSSNK